MWSNTPSILDAQSRLKAKRPPYCANPNCRWHDPEVAKREACFHRHDERKIGRFPYISPRYRCLNCRDVFAISFFSLTYRDRTPDNYEEIFDLRFLNASKAGISRLLKVSPSTVEAKFKKMARWGLLRLASDQQRITIRESIAYDGLENFSFSQYDPNNINHAVGRTSLYCYDLNFAPLNRKGKVSPRQKKKLKEIENQFGRYPGNAIEATTERLFSRILKRTDGELELHTDNHYAYRRALKRIGSSKVAHLITPAKVARSFRNRLFAINHMDMLSRHHLADFKRETIAFAKTSVTMVESFLLLTVHKNYQRPCFLKPHEEDPTAHLESPAMRVGVASKILSFRELFSERITKHQVKWNEDWLLFFERRDPYSRRPIRAYNGI